MLVFPRQKEIIYGGLEELEKALRDAEVDGVDFAPCRFYILIA
jgi:hypothetical protein